MIIRQTSSSCGHTEVTILGQDDILRSHTKLEILVILVHSVVDEDSEGVLVILNLGTDRDRFVAEVPETPSQLLSDAVILVIVGICPVIIHGRNVGVIVLVVIVEGVKKHTETNPLVIGAIHSSLDPLAAVYQKANPSAPILPRPVTDNKHILTAIHQSRRLHLLL